MNTVVKGLRFLSKPDLIFSDFTQSSKQQVVTETKFLSGLGEHHDAAVLELQSQTQAIVYYFV